MKSPRSPARRLQGFHKVLAGRIGVVRLPAGDIAEARCAVVIMNRNEYNTADDQAGCGLALQAHALAIGHFGQKAFAAQVLNLDPRMMGLRGQIAQ